MLQLQRRETFFSLYIDCKKLLSYYLKRKVCYIYLPTRYYFYNYYKPRTKLTQKIWLQNKNWTFFRFV